PDRAVLAIDLLEGVGAAPGVRRPSTGARADEVLDGRARAAYRRRLEELGRELAEAQRFGDATRATRLRSEATVLSTQLARAVVSAGGVAGSPRMPSGRGWRSRSASDRRSAASINDTRRSGGISMPACVRGLP